MTKKNLEVLIRKLIEDKVPNDQHKILRNIIDIANNKLMHFNIKYQYCSECGKYSYGKRWYGNKCPLCHK